MDLYAGMRIECKCIYCTLNLWQAIEAAIEWGLKTVEAGAQGEHKIQRGYLPTATYSAHYIPDPDFRDAISSFLQRETIQTKMALQLLSDSSPFKKEIV
jgi:predicted N-acyltransferase